MNATDLALVRDLVARARLGSSHEAGDSIVNRRCVYCGHRNRSALSVACELHRDLPDLDPKYQHEALEAAA